MMKTDKTRSEYIKLILRLAVLVAVLSATGAAQEAPTQDASGKTPTDSRSAIEQTWVVQTAEGASTKARVILGLQEGVPPSSVELLTLEEDNTPYLSGELAGRQLWRVTFGDEKIELPSATNGAEDAYLRTWEVYVRPEDGRVLKILSLWPDGIPLTVRGPNAEAATEQLGVELYHGFPDHDPAMTLMDALDALYQGGISPLPAKQIKAQYVLWSSMDRAPQPMWAITLRGIPPLLLSGYAQAHGYGKKETQWRIIVDPQARKWVTGGNTPYGVEVESSSGGRSASGGIPPDGVEFYLYSPAHQQNVMAGQVIQWDITAAVSTEGNEGLSMFSVDLVQDSTTPNPNLIDILRGDEPDPAGLMAGFNLSDGVCNPGPGGYGSGYGGTQIGLFGRKDLRQIGGGQNTFGVSGGSVGQDTIVEQYIGHDPAGEIVASGDFDAPCTPGNYTFSIENGVAYLLDVYPGAPDVYWEVKQATVNIPTETASFTFTVDPGPACTGACCLPDAEQTCTVATQVDCEDPAGLDGIYHGDDTVCAPDHVGIDCTMGACCRPDGICEDMVTAEECGGQNCSGFRTACTGFGGSYGGDGTSCFSEGCEPPATGACCLVEGTCLPDQTEGECLTASGSYLGAWTDCSSTTCTGACCIDEQTCQAPMTAVQCYDAGGNYQGSDSTCVGATCIAGACCLYGDFCMEVTSQACDYERGLYGGDGTDCTSTFCENCADGGGAARCPATEFNKLTAITAGAGDRFGHSVAIDGAVAVVGSPKDDDKGTDSGSVYVARGFDNDDCIDRTTITASDAAAGDEFGAAVAVAGDYMVVGAPLTDDGANGSGSAYVFKYGGSKWAQEAELHASDASSYDRFGSSVALVDLSGGDAVAVIGASDDNNDGGSNAGSAYVFRRYEDDYPCSTNQNCVDVGLTKCADEFCDGLVWFEEAMLTASDARQAAKFGTDVDIDASGMTIVVGAPMAIKVGDFVLGKAYVFEYEQDNWVEKAWLVFGELDDKHGFPISVSVSDGGEVVLVGTPWDDDGCDPPGPYCDSGAAYVYNKPPNGWISTNVEDARITPCDLDEGDHFGWSVSISGDGSVALVGAPNPGNDPDIGGAAYAFRFSGSSWYEEAKFTASDQSYNEFGFSTSLSDGAALIGAPEDDEIASNAGAAFVFQGVGDCDGTASLDICDILADPSVDFPLGHDCCETHDYPGCSDEGIQICVCEFDIWCCEQRWDDLCVAHVEDPAFGCHASCGEGNGIPFACEGCPADLYPDGDVGPFDLGILLTAWGPCPGGCAADLSGDCEVGAHDLAILLGSWGPCPDPLDPPPAHWNGGLRFAFGGGNGCLSLEEAVQMLGHEDVGAFIEWVLSVVPPDRVYQVAQFLLWMLDHWPC